MIHAAFTAIMLPLLSLIFFLLLHAGSRVIYGRLHSVSAVVITRSGRYVCFNDLVSLITRSTLCKSVHQLSSIDDRQYHDTDHICVERSFSHTPQYAAAPQNRASSSHVILQAPQTPHSLPSYKPRGPCLSCIQISLLSPPPSVALPSTAQSLLNATVSVAA